MTHVVDPLPFCWSQQTAVPPKSADRQRRCMPTRRDATHCRCQPSTRLDALTTQCRRRPSKRPADATHCRHDPVPTRIIADTMWCTADEEVDQCRCVEVDPLKCRWRRTIPALSHRRRMIFSDPQLHLHSLLIGLKQAGLFTDRFINLSVNCPVHIYAASN